MLRQSIRGRATIGWQTFSNLQKPDLSVLSRVSLYEDY